MLIDAGTVDFISQTAFPIGVSTFLLIKFQSEVAKYNETLVKVADTLNEIKETLKELRGK